jgi:hypothetical protein
MQHASVLPYKGHLQAKGIDLLVSWLPRCVSSKMSGSFDFCLEFQLETASARLDFFFGPIHRLTPGFGADSRVDSRILARLRG